MTRFKWLASLLLAMTLSSMTTAQSPIRVFIDADTANEVDDLYALARALIEPRLDVVALGSAQWQISHYASPNTLEDSQRLNESLAALTGRNDIPLPRGASARLYDWGQTLAQHSHAAHKIIEEAHKSSPEDKLTVISLGANTNAASALIIDPSIAPKIKLYLLGSTYDPAKKIWRKRDFNCIMDPQAIETVLDFQGLETHILPVNVAAALTFDFAETRERLSGRNELCDLLIRRWQDHTDGARNDRVIWDLAVISCLLFPEFGEEMEVAAPPENGARPVHVYTKIDGPKIREEFFQSLEAAYPKN